MPRRSPFPVILSPKEKETLLETSRKYTSPYCDVVRARCILLAAEGQENKEIAERLDLRRQVVSKWRKRFYKGRLSGLKNEPRRGQPCRAASSGTLECDVCPLEPGQRRTAPQVKPQPDGGSGGFDDARGSPAEQPGTPLEIIGLTLAGEGKSPQEAVQCRPEGEEESTL